MRQIVPFIGTGRPVAAIALLAFVCGSAPGADAPRPAEKDLLKLYHFHAAAQAEALADAVERASVDEPLREALRQLIRRHLRRADEEAARAAAAYAARPATATDAPAGEELDRFIMRAAELAREFNETQIAAWLDEHPAAYQPVQDQIALADAYARAVEEEPDAVVRAAVAADLPAAQEPDLRKMLTTTHDRLAREGEAAEKRLREAEQKAGVAGPIHPSSTAARPARDAAPAPASAEWVALQLLDALADAHARGAEAARQVRAEVERLLTEPPQRKAMSDEMLRWLQNHAPQQDAPRDGNPARRPPLPRTRTSPPADPGL